MEKTYVRALLAIFLLFPLLSTAQMKLGRPKNPEILVRKSLLGDEEHIKATNIRFRGHPYSIANFYNPSNRALFEKGIALTTGHVEQILGPNTKPNSGFSMLRPGDPDLSRIAQIPTFDAVVLEFDFRTDYDSVSFEYFFGSEEYPEYVNQGVNDVFAFLLSKRDGKHEVNLARLPDNKGPITVDNINQSRNKEFYIPNEPWHSREVMGWDEDREVGELSLTYQFDGFTTVLTASARVEPNEWYHLKIAIADAGDEIYDSGVFLRANSFKPYESVAMLKQKKIERALFSGFDQQDIQEQPDGSYLLITHIQFDFDKSVVKKESYPILDQVIGILNKQPNWNVVIKGHTDNRGENEYNKTLSEKRAAAVAAYLATEGITTARIEHFGFGESEPIATNETDEGRARNRRVEFVFQKPSK